MMTLVHRRSFVLETEMAPEGACAQLRRLLDAPLPGNFRLEGNVSVEWFCVRLCAITSLLTFRRTSPIEISGRFETAPGGTLIPVSIGLSP